MIKYSSQSIVDVKYGSQQVDKVYHGSDLVWERDKWVEFSFPTASKAMSGNNSCGFGASGATIYNSNASYAYYKSFDSPKLSTYECFVVAGSSTTPKLVLNFPSEFGGKAIVTSINVTPAGCCSELNYAEGGNIWLMNSLSNSNDSSTMTWYSGFSPKSGNGTATYYPASAAVDLPCTGIVFASKSKTAAKYGNIVINFKLPKSKYNAWAKKYNVS